MIYTRLLSAEEAYNESKYRKEVDKILKIAANAIRVACEQGCFATSVSVESSTEKEVIDLVITKLKDKGYRASFEKKLLRTSICIDWSLHVEATI